MTSLFKPIRLTLYYMSHGLTFEIFNIIWRILPTLGYDLKIACAKFQGNRFINDKHALQIYQTECGPGYTVNIYLTGAAGNTCDNEVFNTYLFKHN